MAMSQDAGLSRRSFTKASALAGFAIAAAKSPSALSATDTLKVGLIGCGGRGGGAAKNCLDADDHVKLVALADIFEDRVQDKKRSFEGMAEKDPKMKGKVDIADDHCFSGPDAYKEILKTDIDVVVHATTPYIRPVQIAAAVDAGKHIFTEKPAAVDPVGIRLFIEASKKAEEKGLTLVAGTQRRHQKSYVETMAKILDGAIGEIVAARAYWCGTLPFVHERKPGQSDLDYRLRNWYAYCWVCGDNIVEQHVHNLDIINWGLQAHPVKVFASGGRTWKTPEEKYGDIWDSFSCDYEYPNGVHVISMSRHWDRTCSQGVFEDVKGTKGSSNCHDMGKDDMDPYVQEHINMFKSIRKEGPYLNEGVQVAESTLTAIMGRMSAYTGKEITWEDALNSDLNLVPEKLDFSLEYPVGPIPVPGKSA